MLLTCPVPLFVGFGVCQFLFYTLMPFVILLSSAVLVNLSLLSADVYTFLFGLFLFRYKVSNLSYSQYTWSVIFCDPLQFSFFYILAFILVILGVFIYNLRQPSTAKKREDSEREERQSSSRSLGSRLRGFILESKTFELSGSRRNWFTKSTRTSSAGNAYGTIANVNKRGSNCTGSERNSLLDN